MTGLNKKDMRSLRKKQVNRLCRKMRRIVTTMIGRRVIIVGFCEGMVYPEESGRLDTYWGLSIYYIDTKDLKEKYIFFLKGSPTYEILSRICPGSWLFWYSDKDYIVANRHKRVCGRTNRFGI